MKINSLFRTTFVVILAIWLHSINVGSIEKSHFSFLIQRGYRTEPHTFAKHVVYVQMYIDNETFYCCTGAILKPDLILTAGHCVLIEGKWIDPKMLYVIAGSPNIQKLAMTAQRIQALRYVAHPQYDPKKRDFDISLIYLRYNIEEDGVTKQRIPLSHRRVAPGTKCTALGWGALWLNGQFPAELLYADYVVWSNEKCRRYLRTSYHYSLLCAKNDTDVEVDVEAGDSGSPLICNGAIVGILSFNYKIYSYFPDGYTDTYYVRSWLDKSSSNDLSPVKFLYIIIFVVVYLHIFFLK